MRRPRPRPRRALAVVLGFGVLCGLWVLLVENFYPSELLAGGAAAVIATLAGARAVQGEQRFATVLGAEIKAAWRLPFSMVQDSLLVFGAVLGARLSRRPLRSAFRELPFDVGDDDADAAGRRAIAVARQSFAPNTTVLGFDTQRNVMVVHQLVPTRSTRPLRLRRRG